jgi:ABC-type cobalamin transport system ATPase subunit
VDFSLWFFLCFFSDPLPADRFTITEGKVTYVGRERFTEVYDKVQTLQYESSFRRLYVSGPMGHGKSHLLAALVCFLIKEGKCVIYIPDCAALVMKPIVTLRAALLLRVLPCDRA